MPKLLAGALIALGLSTSAHALTILHPHPPNSPPQPVQAPEIDPASALGALTLLAGALAVMKGKRST